MAFDYRLNPAEGSVAGWIDFLLQNLALLSRFCPIKVCSFICKRVAAMETGSLLDIVIASANPLPLDGLRSLLSLLMDL